MFTHINVFDSLTCMKRWNLLLNDELLLYYLVIVFFRGRDEGVLVLKRETIGSFFPKKFLFFLCLCCKFRSVLFVFYGNVIFLWWWNGAFVIIMSWNITKKVLASKNIEALSVLVFKKQKQKKLSIFTSLKFSHCSKLMTAVFCRFGRPAAGASPLTNTDIDVNCARLRRTTSFLSIAPNGEGVPGPGQPRDWETTISGVGDCHNIYAFVVDISRAGGLNQLAAVGYDTAF